MEIWQFNDPEPLRPFLKALENHAPHLVESAHRLLGANAGATRADVIRVAQGLVESSETVREAVRILVFSPPVEDELDHFRRLLLWLPEWLPPGWHKYVSLRRLVAELASCRDNLQSCPPIATALQVALKQRCRDAGQDVNHLAVSLQPRSRRYIFSVLARRLPYRLTPGLKRRLLQTTELSIGQIHEMFVAAQRLTPSGAHRRWRQMLQLANVTRPSVLSSTRRDTQKSLQELAGDLRILSWGKRRAEEIAYLERLIGYQSRELAAVYNLAKEISQRTRRVVVTLHNASLGAASGWGIPSFARQLSGIDSSVFVERVNILQRGFAATLGRPSHSHQANNLLLLWGRRLVRPRLLQDLWALRVSLLCNDLPIGEWQQSFSHVGELLNKDDYRRLIQGKGLSICFEPPAATRQRLQETALWYLTKKEGHVSLLSLLLSLIVAGEEWLQAGRFSHLVLPIIDKFFISSQRDQDLEYLPIFVDLVSRYARSPLFLLIDDTSRAECPSLQLAMDRWRQKHPFLGTGVFSSESNLLESPLDIMLASSSQTNLFALRPLTQVHNPVSLDSLLTQRPSKFLTSEQYDSSWKDNLPFLYHGTQVAPLAGPVKLINSFPPAIITSTGPMAFGVYYRLRLRHLALSQLGLSGVEKETDREVRELKSLWREYAWLANLL